MPEYEVLIDSDAFIGYIVERDAHHQKSKAYFNHLIKNRSMIVTTNYVITETASTVSRRFSQQQAKQFMRFASKILSIHITDTVHQKSSELFQQQSKEKTTLVDMSNVIVMKHFNIPKIFAFDKVYTDDFQLANVTQS